MLKAARKKLSKAILRALPSPLARRFVRRQDGVAAVEFALVAIPFFALLFAILQTAMVFFAGQVLEYATGEASRLILTGQAQTTDFKTGAASPTGYTAEDFKNAVCKQSLGFPFSCDRIYVSVQNFQSSFSSVDTTRPVTNEKFDTNKLKFDMGGPGCIEAVSVYYQWPIYVPLLVSGLSDLGNDSRLLVATAVFRVEPYGAPQCS
jgi:Flp pilus assembly protein TadG